MDGSQALNQTPQPAKSTPWTEKNALEAAVFSIELIQPPNPQAVQAIKSALDTFAQELPGEHTGPQHGVFVGPDASVTPLAETVRFLAKPSGEHAWRAGGAGTDGCLPG